MNRRMAFLCLSGLVLSAASSYAQADADRFYQAIRDNDISTIGTLLKSSDVNLKDKRGTTPLMYAAATGSPAAVKTLLAAGADPNVKNSFDATALMWCTTNAEKTRMLLDKGADVNAKSKMGRNALIIASFNGSSDVVKLLLEKGAKVSEADNQHNTPLLAATGSNDNATIKLLLDRGADVNTKSVTDTTPLMDAASNANIEVMKWLLAKGADVNAVSKPQTGGMVKNGPIGLGSFTPLLLAAASNSPQAIKLLLDAGANVNAKDVRGMTPLMLAVATDRADAKVIKMLLDKGADVNVKSLAGETAADWAARFNNPPVLASLALEPKAVLANSLATAADRKIPSPRQAVEKSIAMLERNSNSFFKEGGCASCHSQNLTAVAVSAARAAGVKVNEMQASETAKGLKGQWSSFEQPMLQRGDPPGAIDTIGYTVFHMIVDNATADRTTDAMVHNALGEQRSDGSWYLSGIARSPMEDSPVTTTAMALRILKVYGSKGMQQELDVRVHRAAAFLRSYNALTTEERNMRLLGLRWAGEKISAPELKTLLSGQRADGGWAQTANLASDAYATATTLYTLHEMGIPATEAVYRRGAEYLLKTQLDDGSWHVKSRAPKFQPYFQSGFPHDHDQWISSAATAWATAALAYSIAPSQVAQR